MVMNISNLMVMVLKIIQKQKAIQEINDNSIIRIIFIGLERESVYSNIDVLSIYLDYNQVRSKKLFSISEITYTSMNINDFC